MDRPSLGDRAAAQERRRRTLEFGYRVCGLWTGDELNGRPRICVMPHGHQTSPHRDAEGEDLLGDELRWPPSGAAGERSAGPRRSSS